MLSMYDVTLALQILF